jgi:DNA replication protein DnaC
MPTPSPHELAWIADTETEYIRENFVERHEMEVLRQYLDAPDDHSVLVLTGEPGSGKTTLLRRLADDAARQATVSKVFFLQAN